MLATQARLQARVRLRAGVGARAREGCPVWPGLQVVEIIGRRPGDHQLQPARPMAGAIQLTVSLDSGRTFDTIDKPLTPLERVQLRIDKLVMSAQRRAERRRVLYEKRRDEARQKAWTRANARVAERRRLLVEECGGAYGRGHSFVAPARATWVRCPRCGLYVLDPLQSLAAVTARLSQRR